MKLPAAQVAVLEAASATEDRSIDSIASETDLKPAAATSAAFALAEEGLLAVTEETEVHRTLTEEGRSYVRASLPELRLYGAALDAGSDEEPVPLGEVLGAAGLEDEAVDIALANFARKGYGDIDAGEVTADPAADAAADPEQLALEALADRAGSGVEPDVDPHVLDQLERRGLVEIDEETVRTATLTDEGITRMMEGVEATASVDRLRTDMLASGEWQDVAFSEYNVAADAEALSHGKEHILRQTANRVKDVLVGMGFQEMAGPHADAQFWINDCLFMPQDHPARTHWDQFALEDPSAIRDLPADIVDRVRSAHRDGVGPDGEGYHSPWDLETAKRLDLRGHTTSLSMRYLSGHQVGDLEPPQRYFSVEKVYRNDTLDPTHLLEFFQIEGWVMAEDLSARALMGTFTEFYDQFGIEDIEFKPHYNPYTEPSFELFGTHPETGDLVEVGNSGIFRDEVTEPLGVEADVMAWGLSLERLLMLMYGFEDIRDVHGTLC
ncbi:MAG: phenylalanine--tRNA ligase subunit alpha, partial [Haloarculaceae archaeon]